MFFAEPVAAIASHHDVDACAVTAAAGSHSGPVDAAHWALSQRQRRTTVGDRDIVE
jgi:hypothetical protein